MVSVYAGHQTGHACGVGPARAIGRVKVSVDTETATSQAVVAQNGWVGLGAGGARLHIVVRAEPDPRYVFQFGGEPECSPVVFQIQGNWARSRRSGCARQPVFSCRFNVDRRRNTRSRYVMQSFNYKLQAYYIVSLKFVRLLLQVYNIIVYEHEYNILHIFGH